MDKAFGSLIKDHKKVKSIIEELLSTQANASVKRRDLLLQLKEELKLHEEIEENVVYPIFEEKKQIKDLTLEAYEEHHIVDVLLEEVENTETNDETWKAKLTVLKENLWHHIEEEEKRLFPEAAKILKQRELDSIQRDVTQIKESEGSKTL
ncbi:MAG: hemerythrin [Burkholderiales bacterium]|jgi:hemerythrin-like domain-containing protein|nr:hemerythrin [Burkholderiales bacterium]